MIVYGSSLSPFVRKTLGFIAEKGLRAEHVPVPPHDPSAEFRACSPFGKIPAFQDGDFRLADSSAICHYLERKYPTPALFPSSVEEFGRMMWFEEFNDTLLVPAAGKVFFQLVVRPNLFKEPPDMAIVEQAWTKDIPPVFDYLERQVSGPFLIGGKISLADIAVHCVFVNFKVIKQPVDAARWPKLAGYVAGLLARPALAQIRDQKAAA